MKRKRHIRRSGQTIVALTLMLAALLVLALVNVDVFLSLRSKSRLGNAGDAAAIAAARWQGITLNLIGALNLERIDAICAIASSPAPLNTTEISAGILALQERIAFAGPLMGLHAANTAAKRNNAPVNRGMTYLIDQAVSRAALMEPNPDSAWPEKWSDYAEMLRQIASYGIAAGCDNARLLDPAACFNDSHPLHSKSFYEAVRGEDWCWFYLQDDMYSLLSSFNSWPGLGEPRPLDYDNPEFFGVAVRRASIDFTTVSDSLLAMASAYNLRHVNEESLESAKAFLSGNALPWYVYDMSEWRIWHEMDPAGPYQIPVVSAPKDEYNVFGASAATRVIGSFEPLTPDVRRKNIVWTAAAKPFGCRDVSGSREPVTRLNGNIFPLVTPDFPDVRLIPLAGASESRLGTSDAMWMDHVRYHLPAYVETKNISAGCSWCNVLGKWENPEFRRAGVEWLEENSEQCLVTGGPGPSTLKGGTRHAH